MTQRPASGEPVGLTFAEWLQRVEQKLDHAIADHEARLRAVERFMWVALAIALLGGISGGASFLSDMSRGPSSSQHHPRS